MNETLDRLDREGLKIASFGKRVIAYIIDDIILSLVISIAFVLINQDANLSDPVELINLLSAAYVPILLLYIIYHTLFTYLYGASLGKMLCKIAVVDESLLDKPNLIQSLVRAIFRQLSYMAFFLGFAWALGNDLRKTWEDYIAKTLVIELA